MAFVAMNMQTSTPLTAGKPGHGLRKTRGPLLDSYNRFSCPKSVGKIVENDYEASMSECESSPDFYFGQNVNEYMLTPIRRSIPETIVEENIDILHSLNHCSISEIESLSSNDDSTVKANDTVIFSKTPSPIKNKSIYSAKKNSTVVSPFSFEFREKNREQSIEENNRFSFKASAIPKFNFSLINQSPEKLLKNRARGIKDVEVGDTTGKSPDAWNSHLNVKDDKKVTRKSSPFSVEFNVSTIAQDVFNRKSAIARDPDDAHVEIKIEKSSIPQDPPVQVSGNKIENNDLNIAGHGQAAKKIEPWKKKPFQVTLPHRKLNLGAGPKLRTAERARSRQAFDELMKQKEASEAMRKQNAGYLKRVHGDPIFSAIIKKRRQI